MHTFKKEERLCSTKLLDKLFHSGSSFLLYPFRFTWMPIDEQEAPVQVVIQVSKRRYKRAVDRNLIKRRIREAYRLTKPFFEGEDFQSLPCYIGFVYIGSAIEPYDLIKKRMESIVKEFSTAKS
jgi:ribonuclease P protein component